MSMVRDKNTDVLTLVRPIYHSRVSDIPADDRPRERLAKHGSDSLSTADLLAIILRTGTKQDNVMELASKILVKYGGLSGLMAAGFHELCNEHGIGEAKTAQLKAALELGKRLSMEQPDKKFQVRSADDAALLFKPDMMHLDHEEMHILILDTKNQVIEKIKSYKGTVNSSVLRAAEIFRPAVIRNCPGVIVSHNHPSGDPTPSPKDSKQFTHYLIGMTDEGIFINPALLALVI